MAGPRCCLGRLRIKQRFLRFLDILFVWCLEVRYRARGGKYVHILSFLLLPRNILSNVLQDVSHILYQLWFRQKQKKWSSYLIGKPKTTFGFTNNWTCGLENHLTSLSSIFSLLYERVEFIRKWSSKSLLLQYSFCVLRHNDPKS